MKTCTLAVLGLALAGLSPAAQDLDNPLYEKLVQKGVALPEGPTVRLPPPVFAPGQPPANLDKQLDEAAGTYPLKFFLKDQITGPVLVRISSFENDKGQRTGQVITVNFVIYAKLKQVEDTDFLQSILAGQGANPGAGGNAGNNQNAELSPNELKDRGLKPTFTDRVRETYGKFSTALLEKVQLEGITYTRKTILPNGIVSAFILDDRFQKDKGYPNQWMHILQGGNLTKPKPYSGMYGYVVVTELPKPKGALLMEMRIVLAEPQEWFGGKAVLRTKLPAQIQNNVHSYRRRIKTKQNAE